LVVSPVAGGSPPANVEESRKYVTVQKLTGDVELSRLGLVTVLDRLDGILANSGAVYQELDPVRKAVAKVRAAAQ
jgi:hypothetical protein